jgi:hypothetical protein
MAVIASTFEKVFAELSGAVPLDKHDLDSQLTEHAELFRQVCDLLALYEAKHGRAEAEAAKTLREDAAEAGEKITETAIKQALVLDARVAELALQVDRLKGLKDSYIERRHAFAKLVDLHGNQYWSEHSGIARGSKAAGAALKERVRDGIRASNRER